MRLTMLAAAVLALPGCVMVGGALAGIAATPGTEQSAGYVAQAAASDRFEIEAARLALARADRADVRDFAQRLIEAHSETTQRLALAASLAGLAAPEPALTAEQQRMLAAMQAAPAGDFDRTFLRHQHPAHDSAMRIHHAYALAGPSRDLRDVAASAVTKAHQHLDRVRQIERSIAAGG